MIKIAQFTNDIPAEEFSKASGSTSTYLGEGRHKVKIVEVGEPTPNRFDGSWVDVPVDVTDAAGKLGKMYLSIPTKSLQYQETKGPSLRRANELLDFCRSAWGDTEFPKDVHVYLRKHFAEPSKLIGTSLEVEVGCPFGKFIARKVGGVVRLFKGDVQLDEGDFSSFDAAEAHAVSKKLPYVRGPRIVKCVGIGGTKAREADIPL